MIDSRDPGPILHGMMSLDLLKLEGRSGRRVGIAPLVPLVMAAHRRTAEAAPPPQHSRLLATGSTTLDLECQNWEGNRKMLDQFALS